MPSILDKPLERGFATFRFRPEGLEIGGQKSYHERFEVARSTPLHAAISQVLAAEFETALIHQKRYGLDFDKARRAAEQYAAAILDAIRQKEAKHVSGAEEPSELEDAKALLQHLVHSCQRDSERYTGFAAHPERYAQLICERKDVSPDELDNARSEAVEFTIGRQNKMRFYVTVQDALGMSAAESRGL